MNCPYFINLKKLGRLSFHTDKNAITNSYDPYNPREQQAYGYLIVKKH